MFLDFSFKTRFLFVAITSADIGLEMQPSGALLSYVASYNLGTLHNVAYRMRITLTILLLYKYIRHLNQYFESTRA